MDVFDFIYALGLASIIGLLAARKQRNAWEWGFVSLFPIALFGVDAFWLILLAVLWVRSRCPKCGKPVSHQDTRQQDCPHCHFHGRIGLLNRPIQEIWQDVLYLGRNKYRSNRRSKMRRGYSR